MYKFPKDNIEILYYGNVFQESVKNVREYFREYDLVIFLKDLTEETIKTNVRHKTTIGKILDKNKNKIYPPLDFMRFVSDKCYLLFDPGIEIDTNPES